MNLLHLRYVLEVQKTSSITKAAKNLFMGQPNLSKAIKELEKEIGITIFKRTAKGVEPTRQGAEFLSYASTIISQVDELESLYKPRSNQSIQLNISAPRASYLSTAVTDFINSLDRERELEIRFKETGTMTILNDVATGDADIGVIRYPSIYEDYFLGLLEERKLAYEPLHIFRMGLLMSKEHPLAEYKEVPYHELSAYTQLVHGDFQEPPMSASHIKKGAETNKASRKIYVYDRGSQMDLLRRVKDTYMWVSVIPQNNLKRDGLVYRACVPAGMENKDVVIYLKRKPLKKYSRQLLAFLKEYCRKELATSDLVDESYVGGAPE